MLIDIREEWRQVFAHHRATCDDDGRAAWLTWREMCERFGEDSYEAGFAKSALAAWINDQE